MIITHLVKGVRVEEEAEKKPFKLNFKFSLQRKVKLVSIMIATKKMATMLRSGLAILPSLEMVRDQVEDPLLKKTFGEIYQDVEAGSSLSKAFGKHPDIFD